MERDFMGSNSKEETNEAVLLKSSAMQWSLSTGHESLNSHHSTENQLTIFYRGMVNVYNDMNPEKAQSLMLLAGNGTSAQAQAHTATPRTPTDGVQMTPASIGPSTGSSSATATHAPNAMSTFRLRQLTVPQVHGASLARFLEKRRERALAAAPYSKSSLDSSSKPESSNGPSKDDKK